MLQLDDAAKGGDSNAQFNLGLLYEAGNERPRDYVAAARWHRRAAMKGHCGAQYCLALMYSKGQGLTQSDHSAAEWYRRAATAGHQAAQFSLAWSYEHGIGLDCDVLMAYVWYTLAGMRIVSGGSPERSHGGTAERVAHVGVNKNSIATLNRSRLGARLSHADKSRAEDMVHSLWSAAHAGEASIFEA